MKMRLVNLIGIVLLLCLALQACGNRSCNTDGQCTSSY